jgi:hypothetical protein
LLGLAAFVIFVIHPGGFDEQVGWYFALFPGSIPALFLSALISKLAPRVETITYCAAITIFNFGWYWGISYAAIRIFRAGGGTTKRWEGF